MNDLTVGNRERIMAIDRLRGLVMIIMALDHVRDYFSVTTFAPEDLTQSDTAYFLTRWITHFCAPVFVFLSGASAWLYRGNKQVTAAELSRFLLTRGVWLIALELTLVTWSWQFGYDMLIIQVIWAIGWSMIILGLLVFLPRHIVGAFGLVMIVGHNLLDSVEPSTFGDLAWLWNVVHVTGFIPMPESSLQGAFVGYPLVPWVGVMAIGYWFGQLLERPAAQRARLLTIVGLSCIALFVVLRGANAYGEPGMGPADDSWTDHGRGAWYAFLSFLNTTKYPPSLQYLLMTLGPALLLMPALERWSGRTAGVVEVYGRVPFLFYVVHLPLIHALSKVWAKLTMDVWSITFFNPQAWPANYEPSLLRCYAVWVLVVAMLYVPCKLFVEYRKSHQQWWLSYV